MTRLQAPPPRAPRPSLPLSPRILALIEECRPDYELAIGQLELFTPLPFVDERQIPLFPEPEA